MPLVRAGTNTSTIEPQTAPLRLPSPPITIALISCRERATPKPAGAVRPDQYANSEPASPAQAELTTKATTWVRATLIPASAAAAS